MYKSEKKKNKPTLIFFSKIANKKKENDFYLRVISRIGLLYGSIL